MTTTNYVSQLLHVSLYFLWLSTIIIDLFAEAWESGSYTKQIQNKGPCICLDVQNVIQQ